MSYLTSVLDTYELVVEKTTNHGNNTANKVKQEILHGLGNILTRQNFSFIFMLKFDTRMCGYIEI